MALDLSRDYLLIDDPLTLGIASKKGESCWADVSRVQYVQRNEMTKEDLRRAQDNNPNLLQKDATVFHMWTAQLRGIAPASVAPSGVLVPKIGDKITDGVLTWFEPPDGSPAVPATYADAGYDEFSVWVVDSVRVVDRDANGPQRYRVVAIKRHGAQIL
ncbi:hypothetical protein J8F10_14385 [Gemmata sp. G18]|uniref:Uncharacterized protein n=1 Tax=Gemmata palustris TaxID=2822762 RepID=A0ABS5BT52_9BACT|nr:hypothetical protein [Gemmata palustris]MBP3956465.1 hypothetical protein [Gemmata palustris]